ncbi:MAG: ABC transporter ATP-binding protein [Verrucomicrobiota bacterium]
MSAFLEVKDLRHAYRLASGLVPVLQGVTFEVARRETLILRGASGAGKTTLLYGLGGLEKPDEGEVRVEGVSLYQVGDRKRAALRNRVMGFVFQNFLLLPELTALENVALSASVGGKDGRERAASLLEQVGLRERLHHLPAELSGGEQQRVAIARALVNEPRLVLADEPTGNLDSKTGQEVLELLLSMATDLGSALVLVTHDQEVAERGDRVLHLLDGRLAEEAALA